MNSALRSRLRRLLASDLLWGVAVGLPVAAFFTVRGPILTADTGSYMEFSIFRDPLAPLFYGILRAALGPAAIPAAVFLQVAFTFLATARAARAFAQTFDLPPLEMRLLHLVVFVPSLRFAPEIGSVALAFIFCILWLADALRFLNEPQQPRHLAGMLLWQTLALLTRSQAMVLVPFSLILSLTSGNHRRRLLQVLGVAASVAGAILLENVYQWEANGVFSPVRSSGVQLLTTVAYVMKEEDLASVPPGEERSFAEAVYRQAQKQGLLAWQNPPHGIPQSQHFGMAYNQLCWGIMVPQFSETVLHRPTRGGMENLLHEMNPAEWRRLDECTTRVALHLLRANFGRYVSHVARCTYEMQKFFLILVCVLLGVGANLLRTARGLGGGLLLITGAWCANTLAVTLVEYPLTKYTYYFDIPVCAAATAIFLAFQRLVPLGRREERSAPPDQKPEAVGEP
ncbi:MAG: hypothetical protein JO112_22050, partial [Planctomycetes bacterium]|nr:hypothetical protein [Planctomycetota bacterium]